MVVHAVANLTPVGDYEQTSAGLLSATTPCRPTSKVILTLDEFASRALSTLLPRPIKFAYFPRSALNQLFLPLQHPIRRHRQLYAALGAAERLGPRQDPQRALRQVRPNRSSESC
jgi:hypothetical protein